MDNNTITISAEEYAAYIEAEIKLDLIKKALKEDDYSHPVFFSSETCSKIQFVLGVTKNESV